MPSALFLSPHLDDVAFSCGGTAHRLASQGWQTVLCTVFTRSVPDPQGFALACQLDKGLGPEVDYMALRRAEDALAARRLGMRPLLLDLPEAPHRGYHAAAALFGAFAPEDEVEPELREFLAPLLAAHDLVFAPQAIGDHVDHRHVRDVVASSAAPTVWYRDVPYAIRHPDARADVAVPLTGMALAAKLEACAAYASQIDFQFGGEASMRDRLADFAGTEAARLNSAFAHAETMLASPAARPLLAAITGPP